MRTFAVIIIFVIEIAIIVKLRNILELYLPQIKFDNGILFAFLSMFSIASMFTGFDNKTGRRDLFFLDLITNL